MNRWSYLLEALQEKEQSKKPKEVKRRFIGNEIFKMIVQMAYEMGRAERFDKFFQDIITPIPKISGNYKYGQWYKYEEMETRTLSSWNKFEDDIITMFRRRKNNPNPQHEFERTDIVKYSYPIDGLAGGNIFIRRKNFGKEMEEIEIGTSWIDTERVHHEKILYTKKRNSSHLKEKTTWMIHHIQKFMEMAGRIYKKELRKKFLKKQKIIKWLESDGYHAHYYKEGVGCVGRSFKLL